MKAPLHAFHSDPALKTLMLGRCIHARENNLYYQGECRDEWSMRNGCAASVILGGAPPNMRDFETVFGIDGHIARIIEYVYEGLPAEAVPVYGERIVEAIPIGADTASLLWPLVRRALAEHAGAEHRMVAKTVSEALGLIDQHIAGASPDIIDAREAMDRANVVSTRVCKAVDHQEHPACTAAIMATDVLHALWRVDGTERDKIVTGSMWHATRTKNDAVAVARMMASMLADLEIPHLSAQHQLRLQDQLDQAEGAGGGSFRTLARPVAVPGSKA